MSDVDPALRRLSGRIGGYTAHSRHDARETTAAARRAFEERFERQVDPDGVLPPEDRARRAEAARKAYFARLAYQSAVARKARATRQRSVTPIAGQDAPAAKRPHAAGSDGQPW